VCCLITTQPFTRAPALATAAAAAGTTGKAFRLAINVTGYPLPAVIAGTPAAGTAGTYPVTITATSGSGRATAHLTLTISP
jgi:hypothetical protein